MRVLPRVAVLAATVIATVALTGTSASATPACQDPVGSTLHTVHETTGDPGGLAHEAEETWCGIS